MWKYALLLLAAAAPLAAADDAREIVLRTAGRDRADLEVRKNYTYTTLTEQRNLDKSGRVTKTETRTEEVLILYGRPYERLVAKNGLPLSAAEERKEREKMDKEITRRAKETPAQKEKRAREDSVALRQQEAVLQEIADAYDFRILGEEPVDGFMAWIIEAEPKPGYRPRSRETRMLPNFKGKAWITKDDYRWVKIEAEVIRTIGVGVVLARLSPGSTLKFEQRRVHGEVWMPLRLDAHLSARVAMVKTFNVDVKMDFFDYRKFQSDSRITGFTPLDP